MKTTRREILAAAAALALAGRAAAAPTDEVLLFSYFSGDKAKGNGLRLAWSEDGLTFNALRDGAAFLVPEVGESKLMRDPFLIKRPGRDEPWHLLWTTAWEGVTLGHSSSRDLINWTPQRAIPVMAGVKGTRNVWAPEAIWDARARRFVIFWSSTIEGRFPETAGSSETKYNHRLYYVTTRDFVDVTAPKLMYDPGFSVIDGSFVTDAKGGLHLIVKDETVTPPKKHLRIAKAASPTGPFTELSAPFTQDWVEGPTAVRVGEWTYVYYDVYRDHRYGAVRSRDLKTWENVDKLISFPADARHGTVVRVPRAMVDRIAKA